MPQYTYKCKECEAYFDRFYTMDERHVPTQEPCPECGAEAGSVIQVIQGSPRLVDPIRLHGKLPGDYATLMKKIQRANPGSKVYDNLAYPSKQEV